jgi:hypothetical protein
LQNDDGKWKAEYDYVVKHAAIAVPADKADPSWAEVESKLFAIGLEKAIKRRDQLYADMVLGDFGSHPNAREAKLTRAEVAALRLYTGPPYKPINAALRARDISLWATTISLCYSAVLKLSFLSEPTRVYRGVKEHDLSLQLPDEFLTAAPGKFAGGVEVRPANRSRGLLWSL